MRGGVLASSLPSGTAETPAGVTGCEAVAGSNGTPAHGVPVLLPFLLGVECLANLTEKNNPPLQRQLQKKEENER